MIQTPEEKANKLIEEYSPLILSTGKLKTKRAVRCALVCVNKQLELINDINSGRAEAFYVEILQVKRVLEAMIQTKEELFLSLLGYNPKQEIEGLYGSKAEVAELLKQWYENCTKPGFGA